jgi:glutamate/tyrosine decarboxylase-like PLP-dependent enzyme
MLTNDENAALRLASAIGSEFRAGVDQMPADATAGYDALLAAFNRPLPDAPRSAEAVIRDLAAAATPGLSGNPGPNFYGWVQGATHPVGVAADWLTAAWGQNSGLYRTAPANAIAEKVAGGWVLDLLDLPRQSSVGFASGATTAGLVCLIVARNEALKRAGWPLAEKGVFGAPAITVFLGAEAHSTIFAALRYLGFGEANLSRVAVDSEGRMDAADLSRRLDQTSGPKIVIAQAGHINSGAFDPFTDIAAHCRRHNAFMQVDGAFGLWARANAPTRALAHGVELADAWSTDGHKWLQTPYDSAFAIVKDRAAHEEALGIVASYLDPPPDGAHNPSSRVVELSRRARGFAVWAVLQALGRDGVAEMIERHCRCARRLAARMAAVDGAVVMNDVVLNQVALRFGPDDERGDALTNEVVERVRNRKRAYVGPAFWKGRRILRVSVISHRTAEANIDLLADEIINAWAEARAL